MSAGSATLNIKKIAQILTREGLDGVKTGTDRLWELLSDPLVIAAKQNLIVDPAAVG